MVAQHFPRFTRQRRNFSLARRVEHLIEMIGDIAQAFVNSRGSDMAGQLVVIDLQD
jgi:hypothetical protein